MTIKTRYLKEMLLRYLNNPRVKFKKGKEFLKFYGVKKERQMLEQDKRFNDFLTSNGLVVRYSNDEIGFSKM